MRTQVPHEQREVGLTDFQRLVLEVTSPEFYTAYERRVWNRELVVYSHLKSREDVQA